MSDGQSSDPLAEKKREKARVSRTSLILWHAHQNDVASVKKLLEEDQTLVHARDYDRRTPLHVASLHGWVDVATCLVQFGADVNSQDRWKNTDQTLVHAREYDRRTPLHVASLHGWVDVATCLVQFGADVNSQDRWKNTGQSLDPLAEKKRDKARVNRTSLILWHAHQNDVASVKKLLEEDQTLVHARDYDSRTPLHVASLHGWVDVATCLVQFGADVNSLDRWKNTPLADAEGAKKTEMIELLKSYGGLSYGQNGSHFEPKPVLPPLPNKCDWEIDPSELDFSSSNMIGKGSFGEILKANWRGTPVAVKRILPNLSDDRLVIQDFRHEVNLLVKLRHPNIVQFLGAVTERKPLMLITEYLRGGDLHQYLKEKGALTPSTAISFALDIARGMAYLHNEPNVIIHRDLKPRNVLLVNSNADHLKVGDFGLSKLIKVQNSHDVYKMTGETGSYRYMAPEVFKHHKYDKKVDVFSFAMILYEMLEGDPPMSHYEPYEAAKYVADGHRPTFRSKGFIPELKELTDQCWAADMNKRPSFLEIIKRLEKTKESISSDHHWNPFS